jgi:phage terminase small subunit
MASNKLDRALTAKQEAFCYQYLVCGFNASEAARAAGYSRRTANEIARQNMKKPEINRRIQALKDDLARTAGISALMIAREHAKIAFNSVAGLHNTWITRKEMDELSDDQKACIQEISTKIIKKNIGTGDEPEIVDVEYVRIKTYDKQKSLDALSDLLGYKAPIKQELTGKDGKDLFAGLTDNELDARLLEMERKIQKLK